MNHAVRWRTRVAALALLAVLAGSCIRPVRPADSTRISGAVVYPAAEWERISAPDGVGWTHADLEQVRAKLQQLPTTAFVAIVGGRVLMEYGDLRAVSYLASVRK